MKLFRSLSGRLLVLTILFIMLAEVLIFIPSVGRFRLDYLREHLGSAQLASLALEVVPQEDVSDMLRNELLTNAGVLSVVLRRSGAKILLLTSDMPGPISSMYYIDETTGWSAVMDALSLLIRDPKVIMVQGEPTHDGGDSIEIVLSEAPLKTAMIDYGLRVMGLSIIISLIAAGLVFTALYIMLVRPMQRITQNMMNFRDNPEDASRVIVPRKGFDEVSLAEQELAAMEMDVRSALKQKEHLASLGQAVAKINHDLRNILAATQLISDRLVRVEDETVQRLAPKLVRSIDRAIALCTNTLRYGRADEQPPEKRRVPLLGIMKDVKSTLGFNGNGAISWELNVPHDFGVYADSEQLFRVLINLCRNAIQAMEDFGGEGVMKITASREDDTVVIEVSDTGPGLPETAKTHLFEAFVSSAKAGGTGLGLAIARDLTRGHGGDLLLGSTGEDGTVFQISLPD